MILIVIMIVLVVWAWLDDALSSPDMPQDDE